MPKISVVIPVYNTERFIARLIESVMTQTFEDFELILVDDGSKDASGEICDRFAAKYSGKVRVKHNENQGVSSARNCGIDMATGEWVTFIDSDDYILPQYLQNLYDNAEKFNSDFVMTGIVRRYEEKPIDDVVREWSECVVTREEIAKLYDLEIMQYQKGPVIKLFKREILNKHGIRFDKRLSRGEDALFVYTYLLHCSKMSVAPGANYIYCLREGSLMSQIMAPFQTELYGYERMKSVLLNLTDISHPYPRHYLVYWFERVINAIYSIGNSYCFTDRLKYLKQLDYSYYKKWKEPISWKENVNKRLLCDKQFLLYDVLTKLFKS